MYQGLHEAVLLMQMDNGYCDEAGATSALHKLEAEANLHYGAVNTTQVLAADAWCMANHGAVLETACTGEDRGYNAIVSAYEFWGENTIAYVPKPIHTVLNWLFDNM